MRAFDVDDGVMIMRLWEVLEVRREVSCVVWWCWRWLWWWRRNLMEEMEKAWYCVWDEDAVGVSWGEMMMMKFGDGGCEEVLRRRGCCGPLLWYMMRRRRAWGRVSIILATGVFLLDSLSSKSSSFSSTRRNAFVTLAQINQYGNNIFHKSLFLDRLDSLACKIRTSASSLHLFILLTLNLKNI